MSKDLRIQTKICTFLWNLWPDSLFKLVLSFAKVNIQRLAHIIITRVRTSTVVVMINSMIFRISDYVYIHINKVDGRIVVVF